MRDVAGDMIAADDWAIAPGDVIAADDWATWRIHNRAAGLVVTVRIMWCGDAGGLCGLCGLA